MAYPSREAERIVIRVPDGFRRELKIRAAQHDRSLTGEVVHMLQRVMEEDQSAPGQP
ncbi:FitA-like ribbon-helix-helix domain-containing protein [Sphingomonas aquatilis]